MLTREYLLSILEYNDIFNKLYWRPRYKHKQWDTRYAGKEAFTSISKTGYYTSRINGKSYLKHQILWIIWYNKFPDLVDHLDRDKLNNTKENLVESSRYLNSKNKSKAKNNSSGYTGIYKLLNGNFRVYINHDGKKIQLGYNIPLEEAIELYRRAKENYGYNPSHGE